MASVTDTTPVLRYDDGHSICTYSYNADVNSADLSNDIVLTLPITERHKNLILLHVAFAATGIATLPTTIVGRGLSIEFRQLQGSQTFFRMTSNQPIMIVSANRLVAMIEQIPRTFILNPTGHDLILRFPQIDSNGSPTGDVSIEALFQYSQGGAFNR